MAPSVDPDDLDLLGRRLRHYRPSYGDDRLRQRLVEDGFAPAAVDAALVEFAESASKDAYGVSPPEASAWARRFGALPVVAASAAAVAAVDGILPWSPLFAGWKVLLQLPFAGLSALLAVELWLLVRIRYDFPNVSTGIGIGMVGGVLFFFAVMVYLIEVVRLGVR
jgi:hypothetical protein